MTREAASSNIRSAERALQILGCFDHRNPERGISEIAKAVGLHKATMYRIVSTLLSHGYVERAEDGQRYRLGMALAMLGFIAMRRTDVRLAAAVGRSLPVHATASGKVLLAHLPDAEAEAALEGPLVAHTHRTITRPDELCRQLEVARAQGFAFDDEELELGVRAVSAPVRDAEGDAIAALSITLSTSRLPPDRVPVIAAEARRAADAISGRLGWQ